MNRLLGLWAWLPTFRAVAEQEHLSKAAAQLGVSPSAVSRMIGLLEHDVGQPLFNRAGRGIRLNAAGRRLLEGLRSSMRLVDESLASIAGTQFVGPIHVASDESALRAHVLPALQSLRERYPEMVPQLRRVRDGDITPRILGGQLDVAVVRDPPSHDQLTVTPFMTIRGSIYGADGHPAVRLRRITQVLEHAFVRVQGDDRPRVGPWPVTYRRKIAMTVDSVELAADICEVGPLLAVLPDEVASSRPRLRRLKFDVVQPVQMYAVRRVQLELPGRAEALVDLLLARAS